MYICFIDLYKEKSEDERRGIEKGMIEIIKVLYEDNKNEIRMSIEPIIMFNIIDIISGSNEKGKLEEENGEIGTRINEIMRKPVKYITH